MARTFRRNTAFNDSRNDFERQERFASRTISRQQKWSKRAEVETESRGEFEAASRSNRKARKDYDGAASF